MRVWVTCTILLMVAFAGCAESNKAAVEEPDTPHSDPVHYLTGRFTASAINLTVTQGMPFNVTLDYVEDNATDVSMLEWNVTFAGPNGTEAFSGVGLPATIELNATEPGNYTLAGSAQLMAEVPADDSMEGNETVASGNETAGNSTANGTAPSMFGLGFQGNETGNGTSDGNATMDANATADANVTAGVTVVELEPLQFVVLSAITDPCAGHVPQEPHHASGLVTVGAVNQGTSTDNPFTLAPCHTKMTIDVTTTTADIIIRLYKPDGTYEDYDSAFVGGDTMVYAPGGLLEPGDYNAQLRQYATVADEYEMTITFE